MWYNESMTKTDLQDKIMAIVAGHVYPGFVDYDVEELIEKLYRLGYAEGYNNAARQFGTGNIEFFKGDVK